MSAQPEHEDWFDPEFWERLEQLEGRHQRIQSAHDHARRGLERVTPREAEELQRAWRHYCRVIAELDETSTEFAALRACAD